MTSVAGKSLTGSINPREEPGKKRYERRHVGVIWKIYAVVSKEKKNI